MERKFITTGDGSLTIQLPQWNEQYHSIHGAVNEANHVFIKQGLQHYVAVHRPEQLNILEVGFGTGLNALVTYNNPISRAIQIDYVGVEAYPVTLEEVNKLNYPKILGASKEAFIKLHESIWEAPFKISEYFQLTKRKQFFAEIDDQDSFHLIYFDAFGARVQPELWTESIFLKMFQSLRNSGILVTYSAKGSVRRAMENVGFKVERLPGPPGKREMLRAIKT